MNAHIGTQSGDPWAITAATALAHMASSVHGLGDAEARQRLERFGPNQLRETPPRATWLKFSDQFKNFLVLVLVGAAALAGAIGDTKDAVVILVVRRLIAALRATACRTLDCERARAQIFRSRRSRCRFIRN